MAKIQVVNDGDQVPARGPPMNGMTKLPRAGYPPG